MAARSPARRHEYQAFGDSVDAVTGEVLSENAPDYRSCLWGEVQFVQSLAACRFGGVGVRAHIGDLT
jgi:hypothetical protein